MFNRSVYHARSSVYDPEGTSGFWVWYTKSKRWYTFVTHVNSSTQVATLPNLEIADLVAESLGSGFSLPDSDM